jgi:hypothetical protein
MILELSILIIGIAMIMLALHIRRYDDISTVEPFASSVEDEAYLYSCPPGYKSYHLSNGNTACCNGEINTNMCMSDDACVLSGKETSTMPKCTELIKNRYQQKAQELCPASLSSYFEDISKYVKGCTNGPLNSTMNGPRDTNQSICKIYPTVDENIKALDSCSNQKELEEFPCFGTNCTKNVVQTIPGSPVQISVGFTDATGMHRVAYTRSSMERFLDATTPNWRNKGIDLDKSINVAEVAKAYYVDRTIDQNDVQL